MGSREASGQRLQRAIRAVDRALTWVGLTLERAGEGSMAVARSLIRNPTLSIPLATVILFALARFPAEVFYSELGVRPEDVGLNSVQVLLQGSAVLLVVSLVLALGVVAAFFLILWIASSMLASGDVPVVRVLRTMARLSLFPVLALTIAFALWILVNVAEGQSEDARAGLGISPGLYPWRAEHVDATWRGPGERSLPGCGQLLYLGEANSHVVLHDAARDTTYRISAEDLELEFPLEC